MNHSVPRSTYVWTLDPSRSIRARASVRAGAGRAADPRTGDPHRRQLRQVESIHADPARDRLLIADEASIDIKVYTLQGEYSGQTIGQEYLHYEPEGIALYQCGDDGYWLVTDQSLTVSYFHVLDRGSLEQQGVFQGRTTANTDGVALTQGGIGEWEDGVLFPVHDDRAVSAILWSEIADALDLESCEMD